MMSANLHLNWKGIIAYTILALGITSGGGLIGQGFVNFKKLDRTVCVKGISEKEVKANLAIWELTYSNTGGNLDILLNKTVEDGKLVIDFLIKEGFSIDEVKKGFSEISDKAANEYREKTDIENRYIVKERVTVRTSNVDSVPKTLGKLNTIIAKGVIVSGAPSYYYTDFFSLRPSMLEESIKSAREAALQFAKDSGSKVGKIRTANQGQFTVSPKDSSGENMYASEISSIEKKIRVVSTVIFNLE